MIPNKGKRMVKPSKGLKEGKKTCPVRLLDAIFSTHHVAGTALSGWRAPMACWKAGESCNFKGDISPPKAFLKMIFLFPRCDMLIPWRLY